MEIDNSIEQSCVGRREFLVKAGFFAGAAVLTISGLSTGAVGQPFEDLTVPVGADSPLAKTGGSLVVDSSAGKIIVVRLSDSKFAAFSALCTHKRGILTYDGKELACPKHGSKFDLKDGHVTAGPAEAALKAYEAKGGKSDVTIVI